MKKIIFGLIALLITVSASSQVATGVKGGVVFSNLSGFEANGAGLDASVSSIIEGGRTGYFAGFFAAIPINRKLSFQPEFQYVQQGSNAEVLRVDYLQVPLGLDIKLSEKFFANIGPQIGLRIWTPEDSGLIDTLDYSAFASIGYNIKNGIFVEARYSIGFNDIASGDPIPLDANDQNLTEPSFRNSYLYIGIGYRL